MPPATSFSFFARPALLLPACTSRLCHGSASARAHRPLVEMPRPLPSAASARRMLGSLRCAAAGALRAEAEEPAVVPASVPVRVAYEMQQAGHRYLDVRTEDEFSVGHPEGALNIPYMYRTGSGMAKNSHFVEKVSEILGKDDEIIIGCQSGKRSLMAAAELCSAGSMTMDIISVIAQAVLSDMRWDLSSAQPFSGFQCCDGHRRWIFCLEGEWIADQRVINAGLPNFSECF